MRLVDSRRLRGPNLQTREPVAIAEVALEEGERADEAVAAWRAEATAMAAALGWAREAQGAVARLFSGGVAFALPAPIDVLLDATEVNEWAIDRATARPAGSERGGDDDFETARARFAEQIAAHATPALTLLRAEARRRDVPFLWDDEQVTLGMAKRSRTFDIGALPHPDAVEWSALGRIPVALVTGTNGKTTTTRLVARMAKLAGLVPGSTSTDGVAVDERIVEEGDWTGAEAARLVLRSPDVQIAILETARGGILRRGLAIDACDAALITNVASDHLGEFGVDDLATMARSKAVVGTIVRPAGRVVINGDDAELVALAPAFPAKVVLFSTKPESEATRAHVAAGGEVFLSREGIFVRVAPGGVTALARVDEAPLTFGGAARHNVANCLAAAALAWALGLPDEAVSSALRSFGRKPADNPGRGQLIELPNGVRVLLDFGHNAAGVRELYVLARSLLRGASSSVLSVHTQPGDRNDADMAALAREVVASSPRAVAVWESEEYLRGREPGELVGALARAFRGAGLREDALLEEQTETGAVERVLARALAGDVVVVAPLIGRAAVEATLATASGGPAAS